MGLLFLVVGGNHKRLYDGDLLCEASGIGGGVGADAIHADVRGRLALARDLVLDEWHEREMPDWTAEITYYSIVTQTTLGYGDISPALPVARGLAIVQTLLGQLYLAIVVARIVAMELAQRPSLGSMPHASQPQAAIMFV